MKYTAFCLVAAASAAWGTAWAAAEFKMLEQAEDGSQSVPVHVIPLYDEYVETISPHEARPEPFSPRVTCGMCHPYDTVGLGWHFNAGTTGVPSGRQGQPWFLVDEPTGTQLPLSLRDWPGTWRPEEAGLTPWRFVKEFGRHMPGGNLGETGEKVPDLEARWGISGRVEINCLACHNECRDQEQSEYAKQIARENFRWAATAASGLAIVDGLASALPDYWDPIDGPNPDNPWAQPPSVAYSKHRFDSKNRVFFDIAAKPPANRCYFCHSYWEVGESAPEKAHVDRDIHVSRGLSCSDCHRNGIAHNTVRGYEGESDAPELASLTCRGCHLGAGKAATGARGRFAAPYPKHAGLPTLHIERLQCTVCHSGPVPESKTGMVRTSRANRLGIHGKAQWYTDAPYIATPVFARQENGQIGIFNMAWPAFWGLRKGDSIVPLPLDIVKAERDALLGARSDGTEVDVSEEPVSESDAVDETESESADAPEPESAEAAPDEAAETAPDEGAQTESEDQDNAAGPASEEVPSQEAATPAPPKDLRLTEAEIAQLLERLSARGDLDGEPVYVCNGACYTRGQNGALASSSHRAAEPYSWPRAHDVRPAQQALGANGCADCHAPDAPFFFAAVTADSPVQTAGPLAAPMHKYLDVDPVLAAAAGRIALLQSVLIGCGVAIALLLGFVLLRYGAKGLETACRSLVSHGTAKKG